MPDWLQAMGVSSPAKVAYKHNYQHNFTGSQTGVMFDGSLSTVGNEVFGSNFDDVLSISNGSIRGFEGSDVLTSRSTDSDIGALLIGGARFGDDVVEDHDAYIAGGPGITQVVFSSANRDSAAVDFSEGSHLKIWNAEQVKVQALSGQLSDKDRALFFNKEALATELAPLLQSESDKVTAANVSSIEELLATTTDNPSTEVLTTEQIEQLYKLLPENAVVASGTSPADAVFMKSGENINITEDVSFTRDGQNLTIKVNGAADGAATEIFGYFDNDQPGQNNPALKFATSTNNQGNPVFTEATFEEVLAKVSDGNQENSSIHIPLIIR